MSNIPELTPGHIDSPTGIRMSYGDMGNSPIAGIVGAISRGETALSGSEQNTPKGPPIWTWNKWDFMYNAYFELGGFYDGSALVKSCIEKNDNYLERRESSYYENYTKPIIDATYIPVFSSTVDKKIIVNGEEDKEGTMVPIFANFIKDVDNCKNDSDSFTEKIVKYVRILGSAFIVGDNFPTEEIPELENDVIFNRKFPFVQMRLPQQVVLELLKINKFGKIEQICFREEGEIVNGKLEDRWKLWTPNYSIKMRKDKENKMVEVPGSMVTYNLGEVPIVPIFSSESEDGTILPHPTYYSIAKCNWALYNICSAQMRLLRSQMFAIFCAPKVEGGFAAGPLNGFELPANNSITGESYPLPFYCAPPIGPYQEIGNTITTLRQDLYRLAGQEGVEGVQQVKSGIAKSYDFAAQEWVLKKSALIAKKAHEALAHLFKLYVPDEKFDFVITYQTDYKPTNDNEVVDRLDKYIETTLGISTPFNPIVANAVKELTKKVFEGDDEKLSELIEWIDANTGSEAQETENTPEDVEKIKSQSINDAAMKFLKDGSKLPNVTQNNKKTTIESDKK